MRKLIFGLIFAPLLALGTANGSSGAPYAFSDTGPLAIPHAEPTATLLPNGKVLVAGGYSFPNGFTAKSELYDPATGNWTDTNPMGYGSRSHTATLLPDGTVLVVGGFGFAEHSNNNTSATRRAELYNPATGTWASTGGLFWARRNHTATLLPNGKVLVVGGENVGQGVSSEPLKYAEIYDPATAQWTGAGSSNLPHSEHTATLLPNGNVLVAGGRGSKNCASAEIYNPTTGQWLTTGSLSAGRYGHTATLLPNGKVLVAGGDGSLANPLASAEIFDPSTGSWAPTGNLAESRIHHSATLMPNGMVLVVGGYPTMETTEVYYPASGKWTTTGNLVSGRCYHTATLLANAQVLVAGGDGYYSTLTCSELYQCGSPNDPPVFVSQPQSQAAYLNTKATFKAGVIADGLQCHWRKDGLEIPGATDPEYAVTANASTTGTYDLVVSNPFGSGTSNPVALSLLPPPEITSNSPVHLGFQATFWANDNRSGPRSFQWQKDGKDIPGATAQGFIIANAKATDTGVYTCVITSSAGSVTTVPVPVKVEDWLVLVYKISGHGAANQNTATSKAPVDGFLVLDRLHQRAGFLWKTVAGKQKGYFTELRPDVASHSTGPIAPVVKSTTVVAGDTVSGSAPDLGHSMVWLQGTDALVKLGDSDAPIAPLTMTGFVNRLELAEGAQIQALNVSLVLDKAQSATSRGNQESVEAALSRLGQELESKGFIAK